MSDVLHITAVEALAYGALKLRWDDGYEGTVDLRDFIADGEIFEHIRNPENFKQVRLESYGITSIGVRKARRSSTSAAMACVSSSRSRRLRPAARADAAHRDH